MSLTFEFDFGALTPLFIRSNTRCLLNYDESINNIQEKSEPWYFNQILTFFMRNSIKVLHMLKMNADGGNADYGNIMSRITKCGLYPADCFFFAIFLRNTRQYNPCHLENISDG